MDKKEIAPFLDLANHHQGATEEAIRELCEKVKEHGFNAAFVNSVYVPLARECLGEERKVGTVVSFPIGQDATEIKLAAVREAMGLGADELDVSMNVGWFKGGREDQVLEEMKRVVLLVRELKGGRVVKFIIETGLLTEEEIKRAALLVAESGADFVKTCSGWGPRGAEVRDVELIKGAIGGRAKIKVAGGIHDFEAAKGFIEAGAERIGTSRAVEIVT